ncbi:hypothetical protein JCM8097_004891 [Rhodosporidiobolus ruineniae]
MQTAKQLHWTQRKTGVIGVSSTLTLEQQQILAAVPRWKKEWVRPTNLKPGQNPNYKVYKWVVDNSQGQSEGTEEEMQAALKEVTSGNIPLPSGAVDPSATISLDIGPTAGASTAAATPALGATPSLSLGGTPAPQPIPPAALQASANPLAAVMQANPAKPAQAPTIGGAATSVSEAVKPLQGVPMEGVIGTGGDVKPSERSLAE